jgi:hypothetical protein
MSAFDPVVDHAWSDAKMFCHLCNGQLFWSAKRRGRDSIAEANPTDNCRRVRFASCTTIPFLAESLCDSGIGQLASHFSHSVDDFGGISHSIRHAGRELDGEIRTGISLPADVRQKVLGNRGFLDGNVLDEQSQHLFAVFGLCGGSVP